MSEAFALPPPETASFGEGEDFVVDLEGYEGPLDLLLDLARRQKVDLRELSMIRLVDQYLDFIRGAAGRRVRLAADYLVIAAWLTLLKSKLMLPVVAAEPEIHASGREAARLLAFRLAKLQAIRAAAEALERRPRLNNEVFARGDPDAVRIVPRRAHVGDLHGLVAAYIARRRHGPAASYRPPTARAYPLEAARDRLTRLLPDLDRWTALARVAPRPDEPAARAVEARGASCLASTLSAGLEFVRDGNLDMRQLAPFDDIWLRRRQLAA